MKAQREAEESTKRLDFVKKIEEAKQEREVVSKELEETKVELEKYKKKAKQIKPIQDKYTLSKEKLSNFEKHKIFMSKHENKITKVRKERTKD